MNPNNDNNILFVNEVSKLVIRYNEEIDQLNKGFLDYYYNNGFDKKNLNSIEKELGIIQEGFSKMKWNYIENGNKQLFIKEIISETTITTPSTNSVHNIEDQIKLIKNDFNANKERNKKAFENIIELINRFSELNEKFQKEKLQLQQSILKATEYIDRVNKLINNNNSSNTASIISNSNKPVATTTPSNNSNLNSTIQWYKKYNKFIESMGGIHLISKLPIIGNNNNNNNNSIDFELKFDTTRAIHKLSINLEINSTEQDKLPTIKGYTLTPNLNELTKVLQELILDSSNEPLESFSEIGDLVQQFKNVISNYYSIESEIQDLSLRFKIKRQPKNYGELSIQLPTGFTCNLYLDSDYPKYSTIEIQSIQKPNSNELVTNLSFIQKNINENRWNLLQLIEEVDYYLK